MVAQILEQFNREFEGTFEVKMDLNENKLILLNKKWISLTNDKIIDFAFSFSIH